MREHAGYYKQFIDVNVGGGRRRNPKRKNAGGFATTNVGVASPSADLVEHAFQNHLEDMARGGTWGDNMEISAFSAAYRVAVRIHQRDLSLLVSAGEMAVDKTIHIAYHVSFSLSFFSSPMFFYNDYDYFKPKKNHIY